MEDKLKNLRMSLGKTIFQDDYFSEQHIRQVEERINRHQKRRFLNLFHRLNKWYKPILGVAVCLIMFIGSLYVMHQESPKKKSPGIQAQHDKGFQTFATFITYVTRSDEKMVYTDDQLKKVTRAVNKSNAIIDTSLPTVGIATDYLMEIRIDSEKRMVQLDYPHFDVILSHHAFKPRNGETTETIDLKIGSGKWMKNKDGESRLQVKIGETYFLIDSAKMVNPATFTKIAESLTLIDKVAPEKATVSDQNPTEKPPQNHHIEVTPISLENINQIQPTLPGSGWALSQTNLLQDENGAWKDRTPPKVAAPLDDIVAQFGKVWVGSGNTVFMTQDAGKHWVSKELPTKMKYPNHTILKFLDPDNGWALVHGDVGMGQHPFDILHTTDGGQSWKLLTHIGSDSRNPMVPIDQFAEDISFLDTTHGYLVGSTNNNMKLTFYRTEDGGKSWIPEAIDIPKGYDGLAIQPEAPQFFGDKHGVMAAMFEGDESHPILTVIYTTEDGVHWKRQSELNTGAKVTFYTAQIGWALETDNSKPLNRYTLWKTANSGKSWEIVSQLPFRLLQVQFTTVMNGWGIDSNHHILITDDGGKTWAVQKATQLTKREG